MTMMMDNFWCVGSQQFARDIAGTIWSWGANASIFTEPFKDIFERKVKEYAVEPGNGGDFLVDDWYYSAPNSRHGGHPFRYPAAAFSIKDYSEKRRFVDENKEFLSDEDHREIYEEEKVKATARAQEKAHKFFYDVGANENHYFMTVRQDSGDRNYTQRFWVSMT